MDSKSLRMLMIFALFAIVISTPLFFSESSDADGNEYKVMLFTGDPDQTPYAVYHDAITNNTTAIVNGLNTLTIDGKSVTTTVCTGQIGTEVTSYDMVIILIPTSYDESAAIRLKAFVQSGGYVLLIGGNGTNYYTSNTILNQYSSYFNISFTISSDTLTSPFDLNYSSRIIDNPEGHQVTSLSPSSPSPVVTGYLNDEVISEGYNTTPDRTWAKKIQNNGNTALVFGDYHWITPNNNTVIDTNALYIFENALIESISGKTASENTYYPIFYNVNGGQIDDTDVPRIYQQGSTTSLPYDVKLTNYGFTGWYDNALCTGTPITSISTTDTDDMNLWAGWTDDCEAQLTLPDSTIVLYATLERAIPFFNANSGSTLTLLKDVTIENEISLTANGTIYLQNHILDAQGNCRIFNISSSSSITLSNGTTTTVTHYYRLSGGVYIFGTVYQSYYIGSCHYGILANGYNESTTDPYAGAIYNQGSLTIYNVSFVGSSAPTGGAIYSSQYSSLMIQEAEFGHNTAVANGYIGQENGCGGAVTISNASSISISYSTITNNTSDYYGGAICLFGDNSLSLLECTVSHNSSAIGGAVSTRDSDSELIISGEGTYTQNQATSQGGFLMSNGNVIIYGGQFNNNSANGSNSTGGCIYSASSLSIYGGEFKYNSANAGGAIFSNSTLDIDSGDILISLNTAQLGGGLYVNNGIDLIDGTISSNSATNLGGGLYVYSGTMNMTGGTIAYNSADVWGGGFICYTTAVISGGTLEQNLSNKGSAFAVDGGNVDISSGIVQNNRFMDTGDKWSVYCRNSGKITVHGNAEIADGIKIESGSLYLYNAPTITNSLTTVSPIYLVTDEAMIYASSEDELTHFTGIVSFVYDQTTNDGKTYVRYYYGTTNQFTVFNCSPEYYLKNDVSNHELIYTKYVAKINTSYYTTLDDAISNLTTNSTIELLKNAEIYAAYVSSSSTTNYLSIDGNGFSIDDNAYGITFKIDNGGELILKDLTLNQVYTTKSYVVYIENNGSATLEGVTIKNYSCISVISNDGSNATVTIRSSTITDNEIGDSAVYVGYSTGTLELSGNCSIVDNKTSTDNEIDVKLTGTNQLTLIGDLSGSIGIDYNNGLGLQFGVSDGDYTGADCFFSTMSPYIIGSLTESRLMWAGQPYSITYHLYNDVLEYGTYVYGTAFILPTTFQRKGFQFSYWTDINSVVVDHIDVGEYGDREYYANWYQSEIFVSIYGDDVTGDGTMDNPFLTLTKAYTVAVDGNTIAILSNITINTAVEFNRDISLTLCSENGTFNLIRGPTFTDYLLKFNSGNTTLIDINIDGDGTLNNRTVDHGLINIQNTASVTLGSNTQLYNNVITPTGPTLDRMSGAIKMVGTTTLYIRDGAYIHDNYAYFGTIYATGNAYVEMTGGTITDNYNYINTEGGALWLSSGLFATISGKITIKDNYIYVSETDCNPCNVYIESNSYLKIGTDGLDEETEIHISTYTVGTDTDVLIVKQATTDMLGLFFSDDTRNLLFCNGEENEYELYHHHPCIPNSIYLTFEIIHEHTFAPTFTWADDYSSATIVLVCQHSVCQKTVNGDAVVTHDQRSTPDCTNTGLIVHTATFTYDGATYIENKDEVLDALGHISYHGYCSREGCGTELFDADYIIRIDGHYKYTSFDEALNDAASGQTLGIMSNLTLTETVTITKNVNLTSYNGLFQITRGFNGHELFSISNNTTVSVSNIIFDGNGSEYALEYDCGIVYVNIGAVLNINSGTVFRNTITYGESNHGAVVVNGGTLNLYGGTFTDNYAFESGAAIYANNNSRIYLKGNVIIQNNYKYTSVLDRTGTSTKSNVSYTTAEEFNFDCEDFTGTLSIDFNNDINAVFGTYVSGDGMDTILNDTDVFFHAVLKESQLLWVVDYTVDLYLGSEDVFTTPYYSLVTTYMSTYGYLPDGVLEGHTFIGWFTALTGGFQVYSDTVVDFQSSHHLYAHWTVNQYKLIVDKDNGEPVEETMVDYGTELELSTPSKTGHSFVRWTDTVPETMPAHEVSVKAVWSVNTYTLKFDSNGGSNVLPISQEYGTPVTAPASPEMTGHSFLGWNETIPATMPAENKTYTAIWAINSYTIIFDTNGGSFIAPMTVEYNGVIDLPDPPSRPGYTFNNWEGSIYSRMPAHDIYLKARWNVNYYKITFDTDGGSTVDPIWQTCDSKIVKPADPKKDGYSFVAWDTEIPEYMPPYNMNITAIWIPKTDTPYTVQHLVQKSDGTYYIDCIENLTGTTNTQATVTTRTYEHHVEGSFDQTLIAAKGTTVVKVYYDLVRSTVSFNTSGGSTVSDQNVMYGAKATVPSEPTKKGFVFKCWTYNGAEYSFNTPVYSDMTIDAEWSGCNVTVSVTQNGLPTVAEVSIKNSAGIIASGRTDSEGTVTFTNVSFGSFNVKAATLDGKYYSTVGTVLTGSTCNMEIELPNDKINTDVNSNIDNNVSVSNASNVISSSERQSIKDNSSIESMTITTELSAVDTYTMLQKLNGKSGIIECYNIEITKTTKFTDSSTFISNVSSSSDYQLFVFEITDKLLNAMKSGGYGYDNIIVYHTHDDSGQTKTYAMKKQISYSDLLNTSANSFCVTDIDGQKYIVIKTDEYSTFSFGLTDEQQINTGTDPTATYIAFGVIVAVIFGLIVIYLCLRHHRSKAQKKI